MGYPPLELHYKFKFGKHIGEVVADVIELYPDYIRHMMDENIIELSNEAYEYFQNIEKNA